MFQHSSVNTIMQIVWLRSHVQPILECKTNARCEPSIREVVTKALGSLLTLNCCLDVNVIACG